MFAALETPELLVAADGEPELVQLDAAANHHTYRQQTLIVLTELNQAELISREDTIQKLLHDHELLTIWKEIT